MNKFETMKGKVVRITNIFGEKLSGRLVDEDDKYITLRFRSGMEAFMNKDDVRFIIPLWNQPDVVV